MIKRDILEKILPWIKKEKIIVLKGARQVGKTTLLREISKQIEVQFPEAVVAYIDASNPLNKNIFESTLFLERFLSQNFGFPQKFVFLMIDEFQSIENAGIFLKNVFDEYKNSLQLIVSGSSSLEITKNTEFFTGRSIDFTIERISFFEYINYVLSSQIKPVSLDDFDEVIVFYKNFSARIEPFFKEYLSFGGYPEVLTTSLIADKHIILESILKKYLEKDVADFLKVENISAFNNLSRILCSQIGNLVNKSELANTLNINLASVDKYNDILEGTYIFDFCKPYFQNPRTEISKMPKAYVLDLGIKSYLQKVMSVQNVQSGDVIESFVYLTLKTMAVKRDVYFYRTTSGSEIDFVIESENDSIILCESKYSNNPKVPLAMRAFQKKYESKVEKSIIVTKDKLMKDGDFFFIPASMLPFVSLS